MLSISSGTLQLCSSSRLPAPSSCYQAFVVQQHPVCPVLFFILIPLDSLLDSELASLELPFSLSVLFSAKSNSYFHDYRYFCIYNIYLVIFQR